MAVETVEIKSNDQRFWVDLSPTVEGRFAMTVRMPYDGSITFPGTFASKTEAIEKAERVMGAVWTYAWSREQTAIRR